MRKTYNRQIDIVNHICVLMIIIVTITLSLQTVTYGLLPLVSAIEASVVPNLLSIPLCIVILDDSFSHSIRRFLTIPIWKRIRDCIRMSYPFHVLVFSIISLILPLNNLLFMPLHLILTLIINFICSTILGHPIEKLLMNFIQLITSSI